MNASQGGGKWGRREEKKEIEKKGDINERQEVRKLARREEKGKLSEKN